MTTKSDSNADGGCQPRLVRIKQGASVGMDHRFWRWPNVYGVEDPDMVFELEPDRSGLFKTEGFGRVRADGFGFMGDRGSYGNGGLSVHLTDLVDANAKDD